MKRYFLGLAANYSRDERLAHIFAAGRKEDLKDLEKFLEGRYGGTQVILAKNGRSALALALMANFDKGDAVIVNGFTCYAVYEAVKAAGLVPIFADIEKSDLNFSVSTLDAAWESSEAGGGSATRQHTSSATEEAVAVEPAQHKIKGIIVQNTLGNPVDMVAIEKFAKKRGLVIIEDLAHSAGVKYPDGREAGTVGVATVLSFGKEKAIDTISGGAVIFRHPCKNPIKAPFKPPKPSDHLRARFYPVFGAMAQALTLIHLGGALMRFLIKIHWVEKSADNKLDLERKISKFEAKQALIKIKSLNRNGEKPLREFYFVKNRTETLAKLKKAGFYFDGFWYERPVSPERYYKKVHFPEAECKNAVYAASHIVNLPRHYSKKALKPAKKIIEEDLEETE